MNKLGKINVHLSLCIDHKYFNQLKTWALGVLLKISIYRNEDGIDSDPIHLHFVVDLIPVNSPWLQEKSPQFVAVQIKSIMIKLKLWNRRDMPDYNICLDGGLSFAIIRHLILLGWTNAESAVSTCEGHTSGNLVKNGIKQVKHALDKKTWLGKFYPIG